MKIATKYDKVVLGKIKNEFGKEEFLVVTKDNPVVVSDDQVSSEILLNIVNGNAFEVKGKTKKQEEPKEELIEKPKKKKKVKE